MKLLTPFSRKPLHNGELITFYTRALEIIPATGLPAAVLGARSQLKALLADMSGTHVAGAASPLSEEARTLDAARDEQFAGLVLLCRAHTYHKNDVRRRAAGNLLARIGAYGTINDFTQQPVADESADITSLLRDIRESSELNDAAVAIGAADFLDELGRLNTEFERAYVARTRERSAMAAAPRLEELRPQAEAAYNSLCRKIDSFCETEEGADPWPALISALNTLIADTRALLAARGSRAKAKRETPAS